MELPKLDVRSSVLGVPPDGGRYANAEPDQADPLAASAVRLMAHRSDLASGYGEWKSVGNRTHDH
jgi:hypothetical protein